MNEIDTLQLQRLWMSQDPLAYPERWPSHNPAQIRVIRAIEQGDPMNIITFGNGTGKTHVLISIWSAIMFGTANPLFSSGIYKEWPWPKTARLCAPESLLGDREALQRIIGKLFPAGKYTQDKQRKTYYSQGETSTGWSWDVMTYNQMPSQEAG